MKVLDELRDILEDRVDDWSETDKEAAQQIAADLASLISREMAGEDIPDEELEYSKAGARNIAAAASLSGMKAFEELLIRIGDRIIARFVP